MARWPNAPCRIFCKNPAVWTVSLPCRKRLRISLRFSATKSGSWPIPVSGFLKSPRALQTDMRIDGNMISIGFTKKRSVVKVDLTSLLLTWCDQSFSLLITFVCTECIVVHLHCIFYIFTLHPTDIESSFWRSGLRRLYSSSLRDTVYGLWSKRRQTETATSQNGDTKTATNQNSDMATRSKPKTGTIYFNYGRPLSVSGCPCYILPMFSMVKTFWGYV